MAADPRQRHGSGGGGPFEVLDPKLNIFALANGMDLTKEPSSRLLGWYREGLERGILLESGPDGTITVTALCWKTNHLPAARRATHREAVAPEALAAELSAVLESALESANTL